MSDIKNEFQRTDLHMHTVCSDGTDTPSGIIAAVRAAGIDLFSVTDHDSSESGALITAALAPGDPAFINGIEFSCRDDGGKYHILGYGFDIAGSEVEKAASYAHEMRRVKTEARIVHLKEKYGFVFSPNDIRALFANYNPGKPHLARLLVKRGYARDTAQAFGYLSGIKCGGRFLSPEEAIRAILDSHGIPVLAHGVFGDGDQTLTDEETESRVKRLKECGLMGLEGFYSGFSARESALTVSLARKYGLLVTAGSDYHGGNKSVRLGDIGAGVTADPETLRPFCKATLEAGMIIRK